MDIEIVNTILRLCYEQQTCLFEVPILSDYCLEKRLCNNSKYVLASIKNYMEIFRISRDRNRIELFMPYEICRNNLLDGLCQTNGQSCPNLHVCYDFFSSNSCRRSINCPYAHQLTQSIHENVLGTLTNLDLEALTKAFRIYCQLKKHLLNYNSPGISSARAPQQSAANNPSTSSSTNNWRLTATPQISGNASWKTNNRATVTSRIIPTPQQTTNQYSTYLINGTSENGLQIFWTPSKDIQTHFIEVVFSNQSKSDGGPIRTHTVYQHLGIAQISYQNSDTVDRVIRHGPVTFQSFTFTPRLLQRTLDFRHICFSNMPVEINHLSLYLDTVSMPYKKAHFEYYQNDKQTIVVEYNEDIDFSKIWSNVRSHPEYNGLAIKCIQLYHPETLFIEYEQEYSEYQIKELFKNQRIFYIKSYSSCAFVHFYCHDDLIRSIKTSFDDPIKVTPIYIDIYSPRHLENYLQQRQSELQAKSVPTKDQSISTVKKEQITPIIKLDLSPKPEPPILNEPSPTIEEQRIETPPEPKPTLIEKISPTIEPIKTTPETIDCQSETEPSIVLNGPIDDEIENEIQVSDDDFHDIPSEFDNDDLFLDELVDNNGDMEFLRSAAKNLMSSLAEMEAASTDMNTMDAPHSLLYGDDYVVTIRSRRFALAFLDYTRFRVEKQRNPDRFRLFASLKKNVDTSTNNSQKKRNENKQRDETPSPISMIEPELLAALETKSTKKRRNRRNKKKKMTTNDKPEPTSESVNDEDEDEEENTIHVLNDRPFNNHDFPIQRLPHVYLNNQMKPCIVVPGEEHLEEHEQDMGDNEDWHNVVAGGKPVPVSKKSKKKKQQHQHHKEEKAKTKPPEPNPIQTTAPLQSLPTENNSLILPTNCRGFVHNPKLYETFRICLRRSFPSINIRLQAETYAITIDGNIKANVQYCLTYLNSLLSHKRSISISYDNFPQTTITNIIRMQQSTAQVKLDHHANYNRIFRSTYRLLDYQLKQQYNQQQCIYCRRSRKQFQVTYLEFPSEKQTVEELTALIQQRILQLLTTRFTYIAIALSADLIRTKRWAEFYKNLSTHKELSKTLLIRKIDTILQVYGLHANVQQIQTLIAKFLDANRYETDVIETEQASGIYSIFKRDFEEMENQEIFRDSELHFIYRHHRHVLLVQCFQEKFELVKSKIEKMRDQLSTILQSVKSPILSRYYSKSPEIQRIATASNCIITIEQHVDANRTNGDCLIDLKIIGRMPDKAQTLIKEFEDKTYSTRKIQKDDIHRFTEREIKLLENECSTRNVSYTIDLANNLIDLEGLSNDFHQIEKLINDLCLITARRALDDIQYSTNWIYYHPLTNKPTAFGETMKQQLEKVYATKQKGLVNLKDHTNQIRTFNLEKMVEIDHGNNPKTSPIMIKIERRDFKNPQCVPLPSHWTPMTKPWDRVLLGGRNNLTNWKTNDEIQRVLKFPHMLPEAWITEIHRVQNPRMFQQYTSYKENFAVRSQDNERTLYRLAPENLIDEICANGFDRSHADSAFSAYGHGCHFYCKAIDIHRTATLLTQNFQPKPMMSQQQTPPKAPVRYLFVCKVLIGRYTLGNASMKTCPPGYDSLVDNIQSPEVFVTHQDAQVLPKYLITYQSTIF